MRKLFMILAFSLLAACGTATISDTLGPNSPNVIAASALSQPENSIVITSCGAVAAVFLTYKDGSIRSIDSSSGIPYQQALQLAESAKSVAGFDAGCDSRLIGPRGHDGESNGVSTEL